MERHPEKAIAAAGKPVEEMGALEVVEQDDDEGVEMKSDESKRGSDENVDKAELERRASLEDEKSALLVGFKPEGGADEEKSKL